MTTNSTDQDVSTTSTDQRAMELIRSSGVLNHDITIDTILKLTQNLTALHTATANTNNSAKRTDTFLHPNFLYKHES